MPKARVSRCLWLTGPALVSLAGVQPSIAQPPLQRVGPQGAKPINPLDMIGQPEPSRMGMPAAPSAPAAKPESTPRPKPATPAPAPRPAATQKPTPASQLTYVQADTPSPAAPVTPEPERETVMLRYVPGTGMFETLLPTTRSLSPRPGYRGPSAPVIVSTPKPRPQTVANAVKNLPSAATSASMPRLPDERLPQFLTSGAGTGYYSPENRISQPGFIEGGPGAVAFDQLALRMSLPPSVSGLFSGQLSQGMASGAPVMNPDTLLAGFSRSILPALPSCGHAEHGPGAMADTLRSLLPPNVPTGLFVSADRITGLSVLPETVAVNPYPGYIGTARAAAPSHARPEAGPLNSEVATVINKAVPNLSPQQTAMAGPIVARPSLSGDGGELAQMAVRRAQRYRAIQDQVEYESFSGGLLPQKVVSITFDDGPDSQITPKVLETLKREDVKATFFVLGDKADKNPALLRRISAEGHDIGNHSYNHFDMTYLDPIGVRDEITRTGRAISRAVQERTRWFRAPGCRYTVETLLQLRDLGMVRVDATNNPGDAQINDPQLLVKRVVQHLKPGDVILCHDRMPSTAAALPELIRAVKGRGYRFVGLGEMALQAQATPGFKPAYLLAKQGVVIYQNRQQRPAGQTVAAPHESPRSSAGPLTPGVLPRMTANRKGEPLLSKTNTPAGRRVVR